MSHAEPVPEAPLATHSELGEREALVQAADAAEQGARSRGPLSTLEALGTLHALAETSAREGPPNARLRLRKVVLSASPTCAQAEVSLAGGARDALGWAEGPKTPHGLEVVARATLQAVAQLVEGAVFTVASAAVAHVEGQEVVLVLVDEPAEGTGPPRPGCALVGDAPVAEAAVRATLDAITRRLGHRA